MALTISLDELLVWTAEERAKWLPWLKANPNALDVVMQPCGRFPSVGALIDHTFLVEHRHTPRLQRRELPAESGIPHGDVEALFSYASAGGNPRAPQAWPHQENTIFYSKALV